MKKDFWTRYSAYVIFAATFLVLTSAAVLFMSVNSSKKISEEAQKKVQQEQQQSSQGKNSSSMNNASNFSAGIAADEGEGGCVGPSGSGNDKVTCGKGDQNGNNCTTIGSSIRCGDFTTKGSCESTDNYKAACAPNVPSGNTSCYNNVFGSCHWVIGSQPNPPNPPLEPACDTTPGSGYSCGLTEVGCNDGGGTVHNERSCSSGVCCYTAPITKPSCPTSNGYYCEDTGSGCVASGGTVKSEEYSCASQGGGFCCLNAGSSVPPPAAEACEPNNGKCMLTEYLDECTRTATQFTCGAGTSCCAQSLPNCNSYSGSSCKNESDVLADPSSCPTNVNAVCPNVGQLCCLGSALSPEEDEDGDGVKNGSDNCKTASNPGQEDADEDGVGNVCDNCRNTINKDQKDSDGDGKGDVCDNDPTVPDPNVPGPGVPDDGGDTPGTVPGTPNNPGQSSPLCGGAYHCDTCNCPAGQTCTQQCYRNDNNQACLTQSCSNDTSNPIFNQTCTNTPLCTGKATGQHGLTYAPCVEGASCTGTGVGGCGYCQTPVGSTTPTATATPAQSNGQSVSPSCTATYTFTDNQSANTTFDITAVATTTNLRCVILYVDGVYDTSKVSCSSTIAGKYECKINSGASGSHTVQLKFGQSSLYPNIECGGELSCNSQTFTTKSATGAQSASIFGDVNADNQVNADDFVAFNACAGDTGCLSREKLDLNMDGIVNVLDYNVLLSRIVNVE